MHDAFVVANLLRFLLCETVQQQPKLRPWHLYSRVSSHPNQEWQESRSVEESTFVIPSKTGLAETSPLPRVLISLARAALDFFIPQNTPLDLNFRHPHNSQSSAAPLELSYSCKPSFIPTLCFRHQPRRLTSHITRDSCKLDQVTKKRQSIEPDAKASFGPVLTS